MIFTILIALGGIFIGFGGTWAIMSKRLEYVYGIGFKDGVAEGYETAIKQFQEV